MQTRFTLELADVNRALDAAQQEAEHNGWAIAVAVVDDGGHPLGLRTLDGGAPISPYIALEKARSAALGRRETRNYEEMINNGRTAFLSAPVLQGTLTGGVPITVDGRCVGAVGVSGVKPDQDSQVAQAGAAALAE
ncbi:glc operon protein GlcG [Kushneria sinocarnis]|uniref:Glc operon protein GlcG n=1 Tax=Kushneria sinocarnis TaxID=595502 RepID=A0A420X097_9GAMM|nr:heme-binding protein [Kushneria sinocarnis]RKR07278.1 glc operon protein GlcG [Kushneria sinocarnis]